MLIVALLAINIYIFIMTSSETPRWEIPEGYYESVATSSPSRFLHWAGRMAVAPLRFAQYGSSVVDTTAEFDRYQTSGTFASGNIIMTLTHRSALETVFHPAVLESLGLHHARPISKLDSNMENRVKRWGMHKLGAFAVDKRRPDVRGIAHAQKGILSRNGIMSVYVEGTRIYQNIDSVANVELGAVIAAIQNDSLIIPQASAGLSKEKRLDEQGHLIEVARDQKAPFGRSPKNFLKKGLPVVHAFGDPFRLPIPDFPFSLERGHGAKNFRRSKDFAHDASILVGKAMQRTLDRAYELRGSKLEDVLREDLL